MGTTTVGDAVPPDWYADFFTEIPNEFWRRAVTPGATVADVDFIEARLALTRPSRVLDVPCGSGRHVLELARRGHRVTGVDISEEALGHARRAAAGAGLDVELVLGEMRALPAGASFDAAVCMGNSIGYLDDAGLRAFAAALGAAVRPGGGLAIDYSAAAESVLPGLAASRPRDMTAGDIHASGSNVYDVAGSRLVSHYVFTRGAERVEATALHHVHTVARLRAVLADGGFGDVELHSDPDGTPFRLGDGRLLLTARRRATA